MSKRNKYFLFIIILLVFVLVGVILFQHFYGQGRKNDIVIDSKQVGHDNLTMIEPTIKITELESGLSTVRYDEDYGFDQFVNQGGASSDEELVSFISHQVLSGKVSLTVNRNIFGCSTLSVKGKDNYLFGRNFDWQECHAMIVMSHSPHAYASISTVNMDFISSGTAIDLNKLPTQLRAAISLYAPLDGMNEKGLCVSVNMIQDLSTIEQNTSKPDLTTTTAVRLLLNQAASVDEAVALLEQYDLHASMNMMIHFALSDTTGKSVVVEYIDNEMVITNTPVVTNFYLSEGEKFGIGTKQSHERYQILMDAIQNSSIQTMNDVKNAMDSVSKDNFGEFESTEWSVVFNQSTGEVHYYHRENYQQGYIFQVNDGKESI